MFGLGAVRGPRIHHCCKDNTWCMETGPAIQTISFTAGMCSRHVSELYFYDGVDDDGREDPVRVLFEYISYLISPAHR